MTVKKIETFSRRDVLQKMGAAAGIAALAPQALCAQGAATPSPQGLKTVISNPQRDFGSDAPPGLYPDPDVITLDPAFDSLRLFNASIQRLFTGGMWCEGPAWSSQGRYLVWSDVAGNKQYRWLEDDNRVTVFRNPSNNSNGNTFDFQGRQLSCEHSGRRVVRYEHDGTISVIADSYQGKRLNSPNDIAVHQDGGIWFTDPSYGDSLYEGMIDPAGGPSNPAGRLREKVGQPVGSGTFKKELPANVYRVDPSGRIDLVIDEQNLGSVPNGICFSPDYKKVYIMARGGMVVANVGADNKISAPANFSNFVLDGVRCGPDGMRTDVDGNLWCGSNAGLSIGYNGVTIHSPAGKMIGRIRLPEVCANVAFGGAKRNRLFMAAGQSLYAVYVNTQGSAPG